MIALEVYLSSGKAISAFIKAKTTEWESLNNCVFRQRNSQQARVHKDDSFRFNGYTVARIPNIWITCWISFKTHDFLSASMPYSKERVLWVNSIL